ncbi:MAG: tripartite tricarboxylate transporter substrate binding protein [Candidatus Accumulibacter sp.]|nr:tripartite tricarboxylate transporter substrate binding protein [Accumulibacter sp.]
MMKAMRLVSLFVVGAVLAVGAGAAHAATFPEKPVTYLIPFNPGGESDIFARAQQPIMEKALGQSVLITYKTGGGGSVGWNELIRTKPDGYFTVGFNLPHIILQPLQRKTSGYETKQINPVMIFMNTPNILAVPKDSPYKTLEDFLKAAKEKPGAITLGGSGSNTANHLGVVRLNKVAGVNLSYVPFTGTGDAMPAFLGGHVTGLMTYTTMGAQYKNDMRVLAVATEQRFPLFPDVPTFKELGYDVVEGAYRGLAVPPGTPKEIIDILYKACLAANEDPKFAKTMIDSGFLLENLDHDASNKLIDQKIVEYKAALEDLAK